VALPLAEQLHAYLEQLPFVLCSSLAGEVRRGTETAAEVNHRGGASRAAAGSPGEAALRDTGISSLEHTGEGFLPGDAGRDAGAGNALFCRRISYPAWFG